ncbi:MAG: hypothetical protein COS72_01240, partial [Candidatus Moranbacteria bacterium CG06_land_8_20_14_3_00_43_56]
MTGDTLLSLVNEEKPVAGENDPISRIAGEDPDFGKTRDMEDPQSREIKNKRIDQIKGGEMVMSLDEKTGKLVPAKIKGLLDMGVKPIFKITTEDGREIRTTGNHPYLTKEGWQKVANLDEGKEIAVPKKDLMALVSGDDGGESEKNHSQTNDCQNKVDDEHVVHCGDDLSFNNRRLIDQKNKVQAAPVTTFQKTNSFKMPGSTTEAKEMRPVSAAISETFSSCESDSCMPSEYTKEESDVKYVRIAKIELLPAEQVWDIEVEGTHNFVANGIIAHNTYITGGAFIGTNSNDYLIDDSSNGASSATLYIGNRAIATTGASGNINGTLNYIPKFTPDGTSIGNSVMYEDGTNIGIGTTATSAKLTIHGDIFPDSNLDHNLGDDTHRWASAYIGPATLHIGSVTGDEGTISYITGNNVLNFQSAGNIALQSASGNVGIGT